MNNAASFKALLETDAKLSAKFQEVAAGYIQEAHDAGIRITLNDLMELSAVRLHAMTGEAIGDWKAEASAQLPAFQRRSEEEAAMQAIMDTQSARHDEELERLAAMRPEERMSAARSMRQTQRVQGSITKRDLTPQERAAAIAEVQKYPRSMQIGKARELGLE